MSRAYTKRDDFLKAAADGTVADDVVLRKQFVCEKAEKVGETRSRNFIVSTAAVDRDNDSISPKGWQLENYRKNPVVLFAHDYTSLPIGKCTAIKSVGGQLIATTEFADHDMANTVLRLIDGGFLNATSVGFRPIKFQLNDSRKGVDFEEQELLEFSVVPVPANPEALIVARELVGDVETLKSWASETLTKLTATDKKDKPVVPPPDSGQSDTDPDADEPDDKPEEDDKKAKKDDDGDEDDIEMDAAKAAEIALLVVRILKGGCDCVAVKGHDAATCKCCKSGDCECTACAHKSAAVVDKRGRVLSSKNEAKIRAAHGHLKEVLAALPDTDEQAANDEAVEKSVDGDVFDIDIEQEDIELSLDDVKSALKEALLGDVREDVLKTVGKETQSAINRARGRLD